MPDGDGQMKAKPWYTALEDFLAIFGLARSSRRRLQPAVIKRDLEAVVKVQANRPVGLRLTKPVGEGLVYPEPVRGSRGRITSYGDDRVCASAGCPTKLSRYNKNPRCWVHDRPPDD